MIEIKIAQIFGDFGSGGIESLMMNYFINMPENIKFNFFVNENSTNIPYELIRAKGCKVFLLPSIKSLKKYQEVLCKHFVEEKYDMVQANLNSLSFLALRAAKKAGISIRICNSLSTTNVKEGIRYYAKSVLKLFSKKYATHFFGCSNLAGKWLYGKRIVNNKNYYTIYNAVDESIFQLNIDIRNKLRLKHNIEDKFVIGTIGRLEIQKNQLFLIEVFEEILKIRDDAFLIIIGDGKLKDALLKQICVKSLSEKVLILSSSEVGVQSGARLYYSVFDCFVLPSLYEGLPMVGVEAQISSLPCFFSDKITKEVQITNKVEFISLNNPAKIWAKTIVDKSCLTRSSNEHSDNYDIHKQAIRISGIYESFIFGGEK